jgi:hypothetical protein
MAMSSSNSEFRRGVVCWRQPRTQFTVGIPNLVVPTIEGGRYCRQLSGELRALIAIKTGQRPVERDYAGKERIPLGSRWCGKENNAKCKMQNAKAQAPPCDPRATSRSALCALHFEF